MEKIVSRRNRFHVIRKIMDLHFSRSRQGIHIFYKHNLIIHTHRFIRTERRQDFDRKSTRLDLLVIR